MSLFARYKEETRQTETSPLVKKVVQKSKRFWEVESSLHTYLLDELKKYQGQTEAEEIKKIEELSEVFFNEEESRLSFEEKQEVLTM